MKTKAARMVIASVLGAAALAGISIAVLRSAWFAREVRREIVLTVADATGGKVEIASFAFDWTGLRVVATGLKIHGTEEASEAPFFAADRVEARFKLFPVWRKAVDLRYLGVEKPALNIVVYANGKTNIPTPRAARKRSGNSDLETVVDLAAGRFEIESGEVRFNGRAAQFDARGENLRARLAYDARRPGYSGSLSIRPLRITSGKNPALEAALDFPLRIDKESVRIEGGRIATPESSVSLNATLDHLASPVVNASAAGGVSLKELRRTFGLPVAPEAPGAPAMARGSAAVRIDGKSVYVDRAHVSIGRTTLDAAGPLVNKDGGGLEFRIDASLDELARLGRLPAQLRGTAKVEGTVRRSAHGFIASGTARTEDFAIRRGEYEARGATITAGFQLDRDALRLNDLQVSAFEGEFTGTASLEHFSRLTLDGRLHRYSLARLASLSLGKPTGYDGAISGSVHIEDNLKARGSSALNVRAALSVEPRGPGTPVSGEIHGGYDGARGEGTLTDSYLTLPHSRLDVSGSLGRGVRFHLASRNLDDFLPAAGLALGRPVKEFPARLRGGRLTVEGAVEGSVDAPSVDAHAAATGFSIGRRPFDGLSVDIAAGPSAVSFRNGTLTRKGLRAKFGGSAGLERWRTAPGSPITLNATMDDADVADILALAGQADAPYSGTLNGHAALTGTVGNPQGRASLTVVRGSAYQVPFDRLQADLVLSDRLVRLVSADVQAGAAKIEASGTFRHPRDAWDAGALQVRVSGEGIGPAQIPTLETRRPGLAGSMNFSAAATANLRQTAAGGEVDLTGVNGDVAIHGIRDAANEYGDVTAKARTEGTDVEFSLDSNLAGSKVRLSGRTALEAAHATEAKVSVSGLPVEKALALAGFVNVPARGVLRADAKVSGTWRDPRGEADLRLDHGTLYEEKLDSVKAAIRATETAIEIPSASVASAAGAIALSGSFQHPAGEYGTGRLQVHVSSGGLDLQRVARVQKLESGLAGTIQIQGDVAAELARHREGPRLLVTRIDGGVKAANLALDKQPLGEAALEAKTTGQTANVRFDSNFAKSSIHGSATALLNGDYPMNAQVQFSNVTYSGLKYLLGAPGGAGADFDALAEGKAELKGPLSKPEGIEGTLDFARLQLTGRRRGTPASAFTALSNQGPVRLRLDRSTLQIEVARFSGRDTNVALGGSIAMGEGHPMNLTVDAAVGLAALQDLNRDVYSSGEVVVRAALRGSFAKPVAGGRIEFKNATVNVAGIPNGISNLNGVVSLNGTSASIQNLSGETGGGKLTIAGSADFFNGNLRYGLKAETNKVRLRFQGASVLSDSSIALNGGAEQGRISGGVTIHRVAFSPQSDVGSILSGYSAPVETPAAEGGWRQGMRLDVRIRTAPDVRFQTDYTQRLEGVADLNLRGTLARPSLLGRITVTQGDVVFFGNRYTVNQGSVAFYNPLKIEPILNVSLETQSQGVDVTLGVTGPVDNMKLTYRSDPPLQFDEIVALLAAGRTPTSDPTLVAHQPAAQQQSFGQMGESAIVSQAIASPVADRLQRVFGISQVKIDPAFVSGSALPQARLTLQQRITSNITFTYTTDLTQSNAQIVRVEWAIDPRYSAVATRDENGVVGFDIFFKKQFH